MRVKVVRMGDGVSVEFVSHSYTGTYYHRVMRVTGPGLDFPLGNQQPDILDRLELCLKICMSVILEYLPEVNQLQTKKWADLTAPDDTAILRDLFFASMELNFAAKSNKTNS